MDEIAALSIGIAASPFAIIPAVMLLFTQRPCASSLTFLGGWLVSVAVVVAGVALVVIAVNKWVIRSLTAQTPGWMRTLQDATRPISSSSF
jgi:hypothetical protein